MSVDRTIGVDLGDLQMQILWFLGKKPAHGYELMKRLSEIKKTRITQGTLYPTVAKLEEMDLIRARKRGARGKKVFSLTPKGKRVMERNCAEFCKIFGGIFVDFYCCGCGKKKCV